MQEFQIWLMIRLVSSLKQNIFKDEHSDILPRAGGSGCAGCAAAHPVYGSLLLKRPSFFLKVLNLHITCTPTLKMLPPALLPSINFLQAIRRRQLEVDRVELKRKIKEAVEQFDAKLLDLYKTRLAIEKCILAEELKILLYDRRMSIQDHLDREEERLQ